MLTDLHLHTARCRHATGVIDEYVDVARTRGLDVIAFTDHLPLWEGIMSDNPSRAGYAMTLDELDDYVADVRRVARHARETGGPEVLLGIECDWVPGCDEYLERLLGDYPFDVVLGSVHFIDDWPFDDPDRRDGYAEWDTSELWYRYFTDVAVAAGTGLFDVMSHPDLVKKFDIRPASEPQAVYERFAAALAAAGVAAELNTAGLRKPCAELYPGPRLLASLQDAGVPVTVGSDAHRPEDVGAGVEDAREALLAAGYSSTVIISQRRAREVAL